MLDPGSRAREGQGRGHVKSTALGLTVMPSTYGHRSALQHGCPGRARPAGPWHGLHRIAAQHSAGPCRGADSRPAPGSDKGMEPCACASAASPRAYETPQPAAWLRVAACPGNALLARLPAGRGEEEGDPERLQLGSHELRPGRREDQGLPTWPALSCHGLVAAAVGKTLRRGRGQRGGLREGPFPLRHEGLV